MLPHALPNRKPHGDVSDLNRWVEVLFRRIHERAQLTDSCVHPPLWFKSNASALAHGANDLAFPPPPPPVLPPPPPVWLHRIRKVRTVY
jgi:hypothetical protein